MLGPTSDVNLLSRHQNAGQNQDIKYLTDPLKMWHSPNIRERQQQIKISFRSKLRLDRVRAMVTTTHSKNLCLLVCCLKT
jgi:hypothetical protein